MLDLPACPFDSLNKVLETIRRKSEAFEAEMDAAAPTRPCPAHPRAAPALLNREASLSMACLTYTCRTCEHEAREQRIYRRITAAGIPADVRHATLENFQTDRPEVQTGPGLLPPEKFLERARQFAAGDMRNLILAGTPGIGKGHLAAAIAIAAIRAGRSVSWIESARLFADVHKAYAHDQADRVTAQHAAAWLLVLDEVALRDLPADGEEILFTILDRRQKQGLRTLLLSNQPADPVKRWLGSRITDRLRTGGVTFCYGEWPTLRGTPSDGAVEF